MLHDVFHQDDGAARLASRLVVDLEPKQSALVYHVLEHSIPRNADLFWAEHLNPGVRNGCNSCKQLQQIQWVTLTFDSAIR